MWEMIGRISNVASLLDFLRAPKLMERLIRVVPREERGLLVERMLDGASTRGMTGARRLELEEKILEKRLSQFTRTVVAIVSVFTVGGAFATFNDPTDATVEDSSADTLPIVNLIAREAELAARHSRNEDIAGEYGHLFSENASIEDAGGSQFWTGRDAITQRFRDLPKFRQLTHTLREDPQINADSSAIAQTATTFDIKGSGGSSNITSAGTDEWVFVKESGVWKISRFSYNLPR
jgi:hypothetical protein